VIKRNLDTAYKNVYTYWNMKKKQRMSSIPSKDIFVLRDMVNMILDDEELRRYFSKCVASTAEMKRAVKGLNTACNQYLDEV